MPTIRHHLHRGRHRSASRTTSALVVGAAAGALMLGSTGTALAAPDSVWDKLAQCESGGNWKINTGNGYHGGLQFSPRTWSGFGGGEFAPVAYQATRAEQILVAERVLAKQGWNAWPACSRKLGIRGHAAATAPVGADAPRTAPRVVAAVAVQGNYTVKPGDTLAKIAVKADVRGGWKALLKKNPQIRNANMIRVGARINL